MPKTPSRTTKDIVNYLTTKGLKKDKIGELEKQKHDKDLENCTFKPRISMNPKILSKQPKEIPIHERLNQEAKLKREAKQDL